MIRIPLCSYVLLMFVISTTGFAEVFSCEVSENERPVKVFSFDTEVSKATHRLELGKISIALTGTFNNLGKQPTRQAIKKSEISSSKKKAPHPNVLSKYASGIILEVFDDNKSTNIFTSYSVEQEYIQFDYNRFHLTCRKPSTKVGRVLKRDKKLL